MSERWNAEKPTVRIEVVSDLSDAMRSDEGFIRVRRLVLRNHYEGGSVSREYRYDCAERDAMDAVGIVLYSQPSEKGEPHRVCLRSSIRPPLALRPNYALPVKETQADPTLFEIPAGLVEADEEGDEGLRGCASRETQEEVGLEVKPEDFRPLGPALFLSPGLVAEKLHFFVAEVDPSKMGTATLDGSPVEERARVAFVPLDEALAACRDGRIEDIKTEIGVRRLIDLLKGA
jgi:ADP-ribose pyrophosphatase